MVGPGPCTVNPFTTNIDTNVSCSYLNGTPSVVIIKDLFKSSSPDWAIDISTNSNDKNFSFVLNTLINPGSIKAAGMWHVYTKNYLKTPTAGEQSYIVDYGNKSDSYTPTRGQLFSTATELTANSYVTSSSLRTYTFAFKLSNDIPINGFLYFKFPINDFSIAKSDCKYSIPSTTPSGASPSTGC